MGTGLELYFVPVLATDSVKREVAISAATISTTTSEGLLGAC